MEEREAELKAFNEIVTAVKGLERPQLESVVKSVLTFLGASSLDADIRSKLPISNSVPTSFTEDRSLSPKQFILQKKPATDVERIACLGYYLTHYRDMPHFKTIDLSKLNTEAAQPKLSNATFAARNAVNSGYLATATNGHKQISAAGELFVTTLPDRAAAKEAMAAMVHRKKRASKPKKSPKSKAAS